MMARYKIVEHDGGWAYKLGDVFSETFSRPALHAISLATGHEARDASHLYRDPDLMGPIFSAPYAILEPSLALVAQDAMGVAGFGQDQPH